MSQFLSDLRFRRNFFFIFPFPFLSFTTLARRFIKVLKRRRRFSLPLLFRPLQFLNSSSPRFSRGEKEKNAVLQIPRACGNTCPRNFLILVRADDVKAGERERERERERQVRSQRMEKQSDPDIREHSRHRV